MRPYRTLSLPVVLSAVLVSTMLSAQAPQAARHGMTVDDIAKLLRVGGPKVSPDGAWVAYTVARTDVGEDKSISSLWMVSWDGKQDVQLTFGKESAGDPQWSPDGRWLAFTSGREGEAGSKVGARRSGCSTGAAARRSN